MDPKRIGKRIESLRKKCGMTQQALSQKLDVTDKAISKWENGIGYPDITFLPKLSSIFGVTVDYLLFGPKQGIAIAGNIITDIVKNIDTYPKMGMLTYVTDTTYAVGGCVPNTAIDLAKIDQTIPIHALGKVGSDENGRFILAQLIKHGISVNGISFSSDNVTSFCDVVSVPAGERTFFHNKGANAEFSPADIDIGSLDCSMLHIGYLLLLDAFDKPHKEYGTVMASFLKDVQEAGIKTSIDVVSDSTVNYAEKIIPVLKYCNYAIMNEIECCVIWQCDAYDEQGNLNKETIKQCMKKMRDCGVKDKIIIHSKTYSFVLDVQSGEFTESPSLKIPQDCIKGSVGAGDAFCAGCLYALYNQFSDKELLDFASAAAACSLFATNSTDGMKSKMEIMQMLVKYGRMPS
ncbi:MAG: helix-turn-helix domain-containing protein [Oscillospiraceae bacterium]|nr:helix-turn-helix domain-containing protein [Oscillospiraceae bacterium]